MSTSNATFRFIVILTSLTVFNIVLLGFTWNRGSLKYACSVESVIEGVARYIHQNGMDSLKDHLTDLCVLDQSKEYSRDILDLSVKGVVDVCVQSVGPTQTENFSYPILTLFTTWPATTDIEKKLAHNITLMNWLSFKPRVDVVVFTNDTADAEFIRSTGATVYPILRFAAGGAPVLKAMFETVIKHHKYSHLYGYGNSDIIFTENLISSLELILTKRKNKTPVLLVGKRTNVAEVKTEEVKNHSGIELIAKSRGTVFGPNAEDYFITNSAFPWQDIIDVVVGRVAYDNFLVGHVICTLKYDVIDLSGSVLAVHQTTSKGGNFEGSKHPQAYYNNALFRQKGISPNYDTGFVICAPDMTYTNFCGEIKLVSRTSFWPNCNCTPKKKQKPK